MTALTPWQLLWWWNAAMGFILLIIGLELLRMYWCETRRPRCRK